MCLIAIAHRVTEKWPLVIAANRDELYDRPTRAAHVWEDDPRIVGGRDLRAGGSWLAIRRDGRFAAVTNVRGIGRAEGGPSRGLLVADFVRGDEDPLVYAQQVVGRGVEYAGFHLIVGDDRDIAHCSNGSDAVARIDGLFAVSNAPPGTDWPKVSIARDALADAIERDDAAEELLRFLSTSRGGAIPDEVFVQSPMYGTRSSTVIVRDARGEIVFVERNYPGGEELRFRLR